MQIINTADGSATLYVPHLNETYHSRHGALSESKHVFIEHGLKHIVQRGIQSIELLEVGFGTGLNAALSLLEVDKGDTPLCYTTLEPYPLPAEIMKAMNYPACLGIEPSLFNQLHEAAFESVATLTPNFQLLKRQHTLQMFSSDQPYHLVYYDAFAPSKQPDMWTLPLMEKLYGYMAPGGILVTYCAQGQLKRHLKAAGFMVETLDGPPGKKEMVRANKI